MALQVVCNASKSEFGSKIEFSSHFYSRATSMFAKKEAKRRGGEEERKREDTTTAPPNTVTLPLVRFFGRDAAADPCLSQGRP